MNSDSNATCSEEIVEGICLCPLEGVIETISRKWTLQIVTVIGNHGNIRFNEIQTILKGISPSSLAQRLRDLELERLIVRNAFAEIPPRVEYSLTEDGKNLRRLIVPLMEWASERKRR